MALRSNCFSRLYQRYHYYHYASSIEVQAAATSAPCSFQHFSLRARPPFNVQSKKASLYTMSLGKGHCPPVKVELEDTKSAYQPASEHNEDDECELVNGFDMSLGEGDDSFEGYFVTALKNNNKAAILLLTDVYGYKDQDNRDFAYRLACFGYNVLVPDLFRGKPWDKGRSQKEYEEWRTSHTSEEVVRRVDISETWLSKEVALGNVNQLGIIGFCFGGGRLMEALARNSSGLLKSAVCFYGTRFDPSLAANIRVPLLFIVGDEDPLCPLELVQAVEKLASSSQIRVYKGRGHAFAHRPESQEEDEDAEDAFTTMRNWLSEHLLSKHE
ncbi:hypothetical protein O6H91_Y104100 [Diphasiastrum complanatum]|nr:hypothetical protein O6H91_Y104100 [Diphasiastrum complanatum]